MHKLSFSLLIPEPMCPVTGSTWFVALQLSKRRRRGTDSGFHFHQLWCLPGTCQDEPCIGQHVRWLRRSVSSGLSEVGSIQVEILQSHRESLNVFAAQEEDIEGPRSRGKKKVQSRSNYDSTVPWSQPNVLFWHSDLVKPVNTFQTSVGSS